jgi:hypothetical protein
MPGVVYTLGLVDLELKQDKKYITIILIKVKIREITHCSKASAAIKQPLFRSQ